MMAFVADKISQKLNQLQIYNKLERKITVATYSTVFQYLSIFIQIYQHLVSGAQPKILKGVGYKKNH